MLPDLSPKALDLYKKLEKFIDVCILLIQPVLYILFTLYFRRTAYLLKSFIGSNKVKVKKDGK
jgi:hypothetical protein